VQALPLGGPRFFVRERVAEYPCNFRDNVHRHGHDTDTDFPRPRTRTFREHGQDADFPGPQTRHFRVPSMSAATQVPAQSVHSQRRHAQRVHGQSAVAVGASRVNQSSILGRGPARQGRSAMPPSGFHLDPPGRSQGLAGKVSRAKTFSRREAANARRGVSTSGASGAFAGRGCRCAYVRAFNFMSFALCGGSRPVGVPRSQPSRGNDHQKFLAYRAEADSDFALWDTAYNLQQCRPIRRCWCWR
jgi:hypothetical protein